MSLKMRVQGTSTPFPTSSLSPLKLSAARMSLLKPLTPPTS